MDNSEQHTRATLTLEKQKAVMKNDVWKPPLHNQISIWIDNFKKFRKKGPGGQVVSAANCQAGDSGSIPADVKIFFFGKIKFLFELNFKKLT